MKALLAKHPLPMDSKWGKIVRDVGVYESDIPDLFGDDCTIEDIEGYFNVSEVSERFELVKVDVIRI